MDGQETGRKRLGVWLDGGRGEGDGWRWVGDGLEPDGLDRQELDGGQTLAA